MSKPVNVPDATHTKIAQMAMHSGVSMGAIVVRALDALRDGVHKEDVVELTPDTAALLRERFPSSEPEDAILALLGHRCGVQMPPPAPDRGCGCDGPEGPGPWHKANCAYTGRSEEATMENRTITHGSGMIPVAVDSEGNLRFAPKGSPTPTLTLTLLGEP